METFDSVPSKRIRIHDGSGNATSVRIGANTPAQAISGMLAYRFKGKHVVGIEVDDDLVALDVLYENVTEGKEYKAVFSEAPAAGTSQ